MTIHINDGDTIDRKYNGSKDYYQITQSKPTDKSRKVRIYCTNLRTKLDIWLAC